MNLSKLKEIVKEEKPDCCVRESLSQTQFRDSAAVRFMEHIFWQMVQGHTTDFRLSTRLSSSHPCIGTLFIAFQDHLWVWLQAAFLDLCWRFLQSITYACEAIHKLHILAIFCLCFLFGEVFSPWNVLNLSFPFVCVSVFSPLSPGSLRKAKLDFMFTTRWAWKQIVSAIASR